ncbi:3-keto-disaccharide hydrolase [Bythopirellula polymerisocia]|uniref:3-keto-alpha-glucoside-1,2-lyase/3-keto-2-hydroxy-glucal hydratase domain-containing protein n=1 Tax=Bythopirellula polymerisocia TaxID=2528003 RepID=A0A5C6CM45_9BACT|nr:DUF1080 domain-containing protein [Bythopirellula polymerisocia]TWU25993.1 hypothetical protein Pla144_32080 [Bythopirellula polymerisocia]
MSFPRYHWHQHAVLAVTLLVLANSPALAADNQLTPAEEAAGWQLLFDGESLANWKNNNGAPIADGAVQDGTINTHSIGGYILVYDQEFSDFEVSCDVKMPPGECNSGLFVRIEDLADPVFTGLEVQVFSPPGLGLHDFGAIYDLVPPATIATREPGEWNNLLVRCEGPMISVSVNGQLVNELNCDELDQPGLRADGSEHKFRRAIKDFARSGYFGLQDHESDVWFKNIKLRELQADEQDKSNE